MAWLTLAEIVHCLVQLPDNGAGGGDTKDAFMNRLYVYWQSISVYNVSITA